jgi:hypothetical protein
MWVLALLEQKRDSPRVSHVTLHQHDAQSIV